METIIKNERQYPREDYYLGMQIDVRNVFINYGRYLERNSIPDEGSIEDYEMFLQFQEAKQQEFEINDNDDVEDIEKEDEYLEFLFFLSKASEWDNDLVIIKKHDIDSFNNSDDEDKELNLSGWCQAEEFYDTFEKITGINSMLFENCFKGAKYLNDITYNSILISIYVDGNIEEFIIDLV